MDWEEEVLGEMEGGYEPNDRFANYWNSMIAGHDISAHSG